MSRDTYSRAERYEKIRQSTKKINRLILLVSILIVLLIGFVVFGDNNEENEVDSANTDLEDNEQNSNEDNEQDHSKDDSTIDDETSNDNSNGEQDNEDESNETGTETDDPNVKEVIEKDWPIYPTEQEEPHIIDLDSESQDRLEMELAIASAVEVERDQLIYWWLESGGVPDRIIGTVEDKNTNEIYRVELRWITDEGWQPQRVEILIENDQLWRFEDDEETE